jgi:hypothetical protein
MMSNVTNEGLKIYSQEGGRAEEERETRSRKMQQQQQRCELQKRIAAFVQVSVTA